jgi:hypothetical protein
LNVVAIEREEQLFFFFSKKKMLKILLVGWLVIVLLGLYMNNYWFFCAGWHGTPGVDERLALVADPQMEGSDRIRSQGFLGKMDLALNDWYFGHIMSNIYSYSGADYVVVLGDLFSRQDIGAREFKRRVERYRHAFLPPESIESPPMLINLTGNRMFEAKQIFFFFFVH